MSTRKFCILIQLVAFCSIASSQIDSSNLVQYSPEYKFTDGVFIFFEQVQTNDPLPKTRIITSVNYDNPHFFDIVLQERQINFYDNVGQPKSILTKDIWGYAKNGVLYIKINNTFSRITLVGSICHFVSSITQYNSYPSMSYGNAYYDYYSGGSNYPSTEMRQFLLNFSTGEVYDYTENNLLLLFMNDEQLYDEYNSLRKKKKRQMKFIYLRKYNERNPLMLPKK